MEVRKRQTKYSFEDVILAFDEVEGLGNFLEIEAAGGTDWELQRQKVLSILAQLELGESIRSSYLQLLEEKSADRHS